MTSPQGDYFAAPPAARTPGELVVSKVVLIGTGALAVLIIAVYAVAAPVTARWVGTEIGVNLPGVVGAVVALFMRPGRGWIRWVIVVVSALRCVTIATYYVLPGGLTYATFLLLPVAVLVAVNLPAAREYFRHTPSP